MNTTLVGPQFETTSTYARRFGLSASTVRRHFNNGSIPGMKLGSRIYVNKPVDPDNDPQQVAVYVRIAPGEPLALLDDRVKKLTALVTGSGRRVASVITETAHGDLGSKSELLNLVRQNGPWGVLLIEHPHVIARAEVSYEFVRGMVEAQGKIIETVD